MTTRVLIKAIVGVRKLTTMFTIFIQFTTGEQRTSGRSMAKLKKSTTNFMT